MEIIFCFRQHSCDATNGYAHPLSPLVPTLFIIIKPTDLQFNLAIVVARYAYRGEPLRHLMKTDPLRFKI